MDFRTPDRSRFPGHRPVHHRPPVATVPPPTPPQPTPMTDEPAPRHRPVQNKPNTGKRIVKWAGLVILALAIIWLVHGYITTKNQLEQAKSASAGSGSQSQQLVDKVGRLVDLPQGESPTIATVNDAAKLKNQAFFARAQDGDKVLIYSKAGRAVLYRPSTDKIIEYQTVNLSTSSPQSGVK